ncbi:MAG: hypothetical protein QM758_07485 [Armatimonas sp.]
MQPQTPIRIGNAEKNAIENCLDIIRGCQLPDGAFCMMKEAPGADIWIPPYFANHAALALVAAYQWKKDPADLSRVKNWLSWCVRHQATDGYLPDFVGKPTDYKISAMVVDAWDSSAALFLLVLGRYYRAGGKVTGELVTAAKKALVCIQKVTDKADGLTWAKPDYPIKFFEDNIEVYAGLIQAAEFFLKIGNPAKAVEAKTQAARIARKLPRFWNADEERYGVALKAGDVPDDVLKAANQETHKLEAYPNGQAQLFGIAFVKPQPGAWKTAQSFPADDLDRQAPLGSERWVIASARMGGAEAKRWRQQATQTALKFAPNTVYIFRPALMVLGLLEGADYMPGIVLPKK